jgi:hypothetical protein
MKRTWKKWLAFVLVIGFVAASAAIASEAAEVTGTIAKSDQGMVLQADDGNTYIVKGEQDLAKFVDQKVTAKGTLAEDASGKTITIVSIEPAK